jgi:hypothetical protein
MHLSLKSIRDNNTCRKYKIWFNFLEKYLTLIIFNTGIAHLLVESHHWWEQKREFNTGTNSRSTQT